MSKHTHVENKEIRLEGLAASPGVAMGKAFLFNKSRPDVDSRSIHKSEIKEHLDKFYHARDLAVAELKDLVNEDLDADTLQIINAQVEMVNDPELCDQVERLIAVDLHPVGYAIQKVFENYLKLLSVSDNQVARERIADIADIRDRLIQLAHNRSSMIRLDGEYILVVGELSPREVIKLSGDKVKGIIMDRGGPTSHAAIIARSIGIPAVVGAKKVSEIAYKNGFIALDGDDGAVIINPSQETVDRLKKKITDRSRHLADLKSACGRPSVTKDGHHFTLRANIEFARELPDIGAFHAEGIGLLRTESVYLDKEQFDNQDKQEAFYLSILEKTGKEPVTIRLFDAGGDKVFNIGDKENNPFLGWRGIRMLLDEPSLLTEQLRAIFKAAGKHPGRVRVLAPMITNLAEVTALKEHMEKICIQLQKEGHKVDTDIDLGIMVEVPSVALLADMFAPQVDFFSIGTNDLTQYTLAVDRGNELISGLFNQRHPAVWHMIRCTIDAAKDHNIGIAVCGELASDPEAAACLIGMGIDELSMSPAKIPDVKRLLIIHTFEQMKELSEKVLECATAEEVNELFDNILSD